MRKTVLIILALAVLLSVGISVACARTGTYDRILQPTSRDGVRTLQQEVAEGRQQARDLQKLTKLKLEQVKVRLNENRQEPERLTSQEVTLVRQHLSLIKKKRTALDRTAGMIRAKTIDLRIHIRQRNLAAVKSDLEAIIRIQNHRIALLRDINASLDTILAVL
ncbi:MAG: hypothetical protein ACOYU7_09080 [Bacillota bacterium]